MSVKISDNDGLWRAIESDLRLLNKSHTKVGFIGDETRDDNSGLTNAEVAIFNEFGTSKFAGTIYIGGSEARPFMRPAVAKNKNKIADMQEAGYSRVIKQQSTVGRELSSIGTVMQREIQRMITAVKSPANAASTIKAKGSSNPLIDTSAMYQAVTHKEVL